MEELGMNGMYGGGMGWGYWIALFLMGGTNVWTIVMYFLERKKRKIEVKGTQVDVEQKELNTVRDQFDVFDKRLESYSKALIDAESNIDKLKKENRDMQKDKFSMEMQILKLEQVVKQKTENECLNFECKQRIKETKNPIINPK